MKTSGLRSLSRKPVRLSSIDIGTNTVLLLIADIDAAGHVSVLRDVHSIARLGKGVDKSMTIEPDSFARALKYLEDYKKISVEMQCERIVACGTSALRDATNREEFLRLAKDRLGLDVRVLTGEEEAELTYVGTVTEFISSDDVRPFSVLDIGGGSTELTSGIGPVYQSKRSLNIGSVRLTERFLEHSPPTENEIEAARREISAHISALIPPITESTLLGVAGTLTTLAAIDLGLTHYDPTRVGGHRLSRGSIGRIFEELRVKSLDELGAYPQIAEGRRDVILAGILILQETLDQLEADEITVSDRGLRYGIMIEAAGEIQRN